MAPESSLGGSGPPSAGEAHVFALALKTRDDPALRSLWQAWLSEEERVRCSRLRRARDRRHFLLAHALLRHSLSRYAPVPPEAWCFERRRQGRPELLPTPGQPSLRFNLSHTQGLVVCIVTGGSACGIDVEHTERRLDPLRLARRFFASEELAALEAVTGAQRHRLFYQLWTLKEAYLKARGLGLAHGLAHCAFSEDTGGVFRLRAADTAPDTWHFETWQPDVRHQLSVALSHGVEPPPRVRRFSVDLTDAPHPPARARLEM